MCLHFHILVAVPLHRQVWGPRHLHQHVAVGTRSSPSTCRCGDPVISINIQVWGPSHLHQHAGVGTPSSPSTCSCGDPVISINMQVWGPRHLHQHAGVGTPSSPSTCSSLHSNQLCVLNYVTACIKPRTFL